MMHQDSTTAANTVKIPSDPWREERCLSLSLPEPHLRLPQDPVPAHGPEGLHGSPLHTPAGTELDGRGQRGMSAAGPRQVSGASAAPLGPSSRARQGAPGPGPRTEAGQGTGCAGARLPSHSQPGRAGAKPPRPDVRQPPRRRSPSPRGSRSPGPGSPRAGASSRGWQSAARRPRSVPRPGSHTSAAGRGRTAGSGGSAAAQAGPSHRPGAPLAGSAAPAPSAPAPSAPVPRPLPALRPRFGSVRFAARSRRPALTSRPGPLRRRPRSHRPRAAPPRPARLWAAGPGRDRPHPAGG